MSVVALRRIWAAVTAHPDWPMRRLADETGMGASDLGCGLYMLEAAGYIERAQHKHHPLRVLVPFIAPWRRMPRRAVRPFVASDPANWAPTPEATDG